ncbi:lytic murein transglycosylase B [Uliginosibacterium paludis]|uniref:Lytic murein transglycosylase B n=1 Tax=Uliginosibacterium paludis TaxID=1615952 RepID=A0ABV2CVV2_9RHOO
MILSFARPGIALLTLTLSAYCSAAYFTDRADVQAFIAEVSARQGIPAAELRTALEGATPLPRVIELVKPPADPGVRSWQRYRSRFIDKARIQGGLSFWRDHQQAIADASARSGVPEEIIVSFIGVETVYGRNTGNFSALSALATLAFDYPPRAPLFRRELEELFLLAREQGHPVESYKGSYAGALGYPQFLPSSIRRYAVDGDRDGDIDLRNSPTDAIYSIANFLVEHGWVPGGKIVMPARIADEAQAARLVAAGILPSLDAASLQAAGVSSMLPADSNEHITFVDLVSPGGPTEYWLGFRNFYVITRYNRSSFYAMVVHDLAQALRSAKASAPARTANPR